MQTAKNATFRVEEELPFLDPIIAKWFNNRYEGLTEPQIRAIPLIHARNNVLVSSPTGTGKTMTGFLAILNELFLKAREDVLEDQIYCLYISPLKALANDIDKNLKQPLSEIYEVAKEEGLDLPQIRVAVRSGDTPQSERQKMLRKPPHILITTPESFSLSLSAPKFREKFKDLKYVILDEIHEISATKRGTLLSINLERLESITDGFVRIGLSATQAPLELIGTYLVGYDGDRRRDFKIINIDTKRFLDLKTITPVKDLTRTSYEVANDKMYDILANLISEHRTTLVFTNTRSGAEHVAMRLKARGVESIEAHHSSLGKETRIDVENKLKAGELKCVITSTSLELGIDIGYIDLVVQIGSPKSVSKGLQRIGRSGHGINELSKGRFLIFSLDDLMECVVLTKAAYDQDIDKVVIPTNSLDVLSQAVVGMSLEKVWKLKDAYNIIKNSFSFHTLEYDDFLATIHYLSGRIEDSTIYPKIWYDEDEGAFGKKKSTRMIYFMNVGTIPEEADYQVISEKGKHLGQLSDKFVERLKKGDIFVLGARTYMYLKASKNRVYVKDATGMRPTVPSWTGEMLPRSYDLGVLVGKFREEALQKIEAGEEVKKWLMEEYRMDEFGANSLISYIGTQAKFDLPTDTHLLVEGYKDTDDLYSMIFHIPLGRRVNDALSRAYGQALSNKYSINTRITITDDGFVLTSPRKIQIKEMMDILNSENFEDIVKRSISNTEVFKQRFRHCASRSLMVLRKYKGYDISVVRQQLRSDKVLKTLDQYRNFPVIKETYHEIMNDMMDVPRAKQFIADVIEKGNYSILDYKSETSPFSYGLILAGVSDMVLMEDRSKLLKELQGKILDKIYGSEKISFIFTDIKIPENYFKNKVPRIEDERSYESFLRHFFYIDPKKNRFNSPFPYAEIATSDITEDYVEEDKLISIFARGTQWVHRDYYDAARTIFSSGIELNEIRQKILDECDGKTFNELRDTLGITENDLKDELIRLESSYQIRKKFRSGITTYYRNEIEKKELDRKQAVVEAVKLILSSYGPLTLDEILIRLPLESDEVSEALSFVVSSEEAVYDYITPVFVKQYIMKSDLDVLLGQSEFDILKERIRNFSLPVQNVSEYFEKYGFAYDEWDIRARVIKFDSKEMKDLMDRKAVIYARAVKNKYVYIAQWLAEALHALRHEELSEDEKAFYNFIEEGHNTEKDLMERTGNPHKVVRQVLKMLEYRMAIQKVQDGYYIPLYGTDAPSDPIPYMKLLIDKYGPVSSEEISRTFWFHANEIIPKLGMKPTYFSNNLFYGNTELSIKEKTGIIVRINDPLGMYLGSTYTSDIDFNGKFILDGEEEGTLSIDQEDQSLWIEDVSIEGEESAGRFLETVKEIKERYGFVSAVVKSPDSGFINAAKKQGFTVNKEILAIGDAELSDINEEILLSHAVRSMSKKKPSNEMIFTLLRDQQLGIRTEIEANYLGLTNAQLKNYHQSKLLFNFNGPFGINTLATIDVISLYRAIREKEFSEEEQRVLRTVIEEDGASESEILSRMKKSIFGAKDVIKALYSRAVLARDSSRRFIFVPEKYKKAEAVEALIKAMLKTFGFFDRERYIKVTGIEPDKNFEASVERNLKAGKIRAIIMSDSKKLVYVSSGLNIEEPPKGKISRILNPKDVLTLYFGDYLKSRFGTINMYFYFLDQRIVTAFSGKKSLRSVEVTKIFGDKKFRDLLKKEMNEVGYAVSFN